MATKYTTTEVLELLEDSDFGFSNSESDETGDARDGGIYSYRVKPKITSAQLSFLKKSVEDTSQHSFQNVCCS